MNQAFNLFFEYNNHKYEALIADDLVRDGMMLEVWEVTNEHHEHIIEVFFSDADQSLTFSAFQRNLPVPLVEKALATARARLKPLL